jgi:hypothetical protein
MTSIAPLQVLKAQAKLQQTTTRTPRERIPPVQ